jgi:hypothetical protein
MKYLLPLWEKVAAEGCRMRGLYPRGDVYPRRQPLTEAEFVLSVGVALSHKGRGRINEQR